MDNFFDNSRIIASVWKWKIHIAFVVFIAIVVSAVISSPIFIEPKFKSSARIYPVNIEEASKESESEHLLEYLQSSDIKFRVIDNFKLDEVYEIDRNHNLYQTYILAEYNKNIKYKKTDFEAIEISVLDTDPHRAKKIADSLIIYVNERIHTEKSKVYLENANLFKRALDTKNAQIDSVHTIIESIRAETGLIDYFAQAVSASRGLMDAAAFGGDRQPAEDMLKHLVESGGNLRRHQELLDDYESHADTLKARHDRFYNLAISNIPYSKVVEYPFVADKKSYPVRWLIVLLATMGTAFVSVITVSLIDFFREDNATV